MAQMLCSCSMKMSFRLVLRPYQRGIGLAFAQMLQLLFACFVKREPCSPSNHRICLLMTCDECALRQECTHAGELLIMRHTHEVRLVNAPAIVGESVLLNLLPGEDHVRPVTLRAIAPCVFWVLTLKDLQHIFQVTLLATHQCADNGVFTDG